ncbi:putative uncharacterized protein [Clostridium sp. CAG:81]|nr:putative uncharacterized protein [Clostridium sp. CAG:81]
MSKERIQKLCDYIDKNRAKNYPIHNSFLSDETDYIKNAYFKMLAVILQQGNEIGAGQRNLFERQIVGGNCDYTVADYFRQALDIKIDEYVDFTEQCKEMAVKYRFILDALLLTAVDSKDESQIKLVASFVESLKISKDELKYLSSLAKAILEQSLAEYVTAEQQCSNSVPNDVAKEYIGTMIQGNVCANDTMTIIHSSRSHDISVDKLSVVAERKTPKIKLANIDISLAQYQLTFKGYDEVVIENCVFEGEKYPIRFDDCRKVIIKASSFRNFSQFALVEANVGEVEISETQFENCIYKYSSSSSDWMEMGCVIYSNYPAGNGRNHLISCTFRGCGGRNTSNYYRSAFISNIKSDLDRCHFEDCWHYNSNSNIDPESDKRRMFTADSRAMHCTVTNSANII